LYNSPNISGTFFSLGLNGVYQKSKSLGTLLLIPDYHFLDNGIYFLFHKTLGSLDLNGGIRYDQRNFTGEDHWVDSLNQAPTSPNSPNSFHEFLGFSSNFSGLAYSLGGTYTFKNHLYIKANLARGWRAPNVAECGANGVHDGTVVYEIGNPLLKPETSFEQDLSFGYRSSQIHFEFNLFNNQIQRFIYAQGLKSISGGDSINNSLNAAGLGAAPVYKFTQNAAELYGGEGLVNYKPLFLPGLEIESSISYVFGSILHEPDSSKYLPFVPPTKIYTELRYNFKPVFNRIKDLYLKVGWLDCFEQKDIYQQYAIYNGLNTQITPYEYAASKRASQGYSLFSLGAGGKIYRKGKIWGDLYFLCSNIFNTPYIDYMSRFKYYPVNYTTHQVGVYNMGRNLSIKLILPLDI
jgi:iron complex outermembrane receptor protein